MSTARNNASMLLWLMIILAGIYYAVSVVRIQSDIAAFFPTSKQNDVALKYALEQARGGQASRLLMLELSGEKPDLIAQASRLLSRFLDAHADVYLVNNGEKGLFDKETGFLFQYRYLFSPGTNDNAFTQDALKSEFSQRLQELSSSLPLQNKKLLTRDPTMALGKYLAGMGAFNQPDKYHGVWFTRDKQRALLILYLKDEGYDIDRFEKFMRDVRGRMDAADFTQGIRLVFSGPGIFAYESRRVIENETRLFSIIASIVILVVIFLFYRSIPWLFMSAVPLLVSIIIAIDLTHYVFSGIHGITLAFGVILLGIGIDYPVHYFSHVRRGVEPQQGIRKIWRTVFLGVVTSGLGFSVMGVSDFEGLRQLGFFAISGLLTAALCTRWLLPAIPLSGNNFVSNEKLVLIPYRLLLKYRWLLLSLVLASIVIFASKGFSSFSINGLRQLSPVPEGVYKKDQDLRQQMGVSANNRILLVVGDSSEAVLRQTEMMTADLKSAPLAGIVGQVQSVSTILPSLATQQQRRTALPSDSVLKQNMASALQGLPFREGVFAAFVHDIDASRLLVPVGFEDFANGLGVGLLGLKLGFLMQQNGHQWYSIIQVSGLERTDILRQWIKEKNYRNVYFLDLGETVDNLVDQYMFDIIEKSLYGLGLIMTVLLVALRSLSQVFKVILPVLLAIAFTLSVLILAGEKLSLFHFISMLLVLGIGIDYGLFMTRQESPADKLDTLHSLLVCVISTTAVFMIISFSSILVLHAVGSTVAIGVAVSFVLSVLFSLISHKKTLLAL